MYLNTKASQLFGEETDYINSKKFELSDKWEYEHTYDRSKTDMLQFSVVQGICKCTHAYKKLCYTIFPIHWLMTCV